MSDFSQTGQVCTLQRLNDRHMVEIESRLGAIAQRAPITLVLPCHGSDLAAPALRHIIRSIAGAEWLSAAILSINGASAEAVTAARAEAEGTLGEKLCVVDNDAPAMRAEHAQRLGCHVDALPVGKGLNVWAAVGAALRRNRQTVVVTQDCDVVSFQRESLARLCYAAIEPRLGFYFAKMYYSRVTDRLYGRVSRLFMTPLLQAVVRLEGMHPLLAFLLSFRYPLAGECALAGALAADLRWGGGWGLEIVQLCDVFRRAEPGRVAQVDGGTGYDHKHRAADWSTGGLAPMCREIAQALLAELATEGLETRGDFRRALREAYRREAEVALRRSEALALINDLPFDRDSEAAAVARFATELKVEAGPMAALPAWRRLF